MKEPEFKKRCRTCKYRTMMSHNKHMSAIACGYILATGHMRGMPGEQCTRYEKGEPVRNHEF